MVLTTRALLHCSAIGHDILDFYAPVYLLQISLNRFVDDSQYPAGSFFSGLIDDVRVYNRAVSP